MSEPTIKPVLWRCACDRRPCLGLQMCRETAPTPLYDDDALLSAFALGAAWAVDADDSVTLGDTYRAARERLTGVKR
jgi:hypothetical protein